MQQVGWLLLYCVSLKVQLFLSSPNGDELWSPSCPRFKFYVFFFVYKTCALEGGLKRSHKIHMNVVKNYEREQRYLQHYYDGDST